MWKGEFEMTDTQIATAEDRAPEVPAATSIIAVIERAALNPNVDIDKMERLLQMQERVIAIQAKAEHAAAKTAAMAEMPTIPKRGRGHNDARYATLEDIISITRPVLSRHGLILDFGVTVDGDHIIVTAKITHQNGHEETTSLPLPFDKSGSKNAVQAIGSSQTYGQRYTAQAILGLSLGEDTDDDGAAGGAGPTVSPEQFTILRDLIETSGSREAAMLKAFGAPSLEQFPAAKFDDAVAALKRKTPKGAE